MQICLCGANAGYPHDEACPRPYYGWSGVEGTKWTREYLVRQAYIRGVDAFRDGVVRYNADESLAEILDRAKVEGIGREVHVEWLRGWSAAKVEAHPSVPFDPYNGRTWQGEPWGVA